MITEDELANQNRGKEPEETAWVQRYALLIYDILTNTFFLGVVIFSSLTYWYFHKYCSKTEINPYEIRYYITVFLLLCFVMVFGVMRMYNAIVANTAYLLKFKSAVKDITKEINRLHLNMQTDSKNLSRVTKEFSRSIQVFINFIKK